jgi:hypothetical protein
VVPRVGLKMVAKRKIRTSAENLTPVVQSVAMLSYIVSEENHEKTSVRISDLQDKIRTRNLPNTGQQC